MVIDPRDKEGLGITIPFPRVNNHIDMDPSGIIPIIWILKPKRDFHNIRFIWFEVMLW